MEFSTNLLNLCNLWTIHVVSSHGHGEDAGTVPLDVVDRFESTDWPMMTWPGTDIDTPAWIRCHHISCDDLIHTHRLTGIVT